MPDDRAPEELSPRGKFKLAGLLTVKAFRDTASISIMRHKLEELTQESALTQTDNDAAAKGEDK